MYRPVLNGVESHHVAVIDRRGVRHVDLGPGKGTSEEDRIVGNDRSQILLLVSYPFTHSSKPPPAPRVAAPAFHRYRQLDPSTRMGGFQRCTSGRAMPPPPAGPRWDFGYQISNLRLAVAKRTFCEGHFRCTLAQTHLSILRPSRPLTPFVRHAATGLQGPLAIP